MADGGWRAPNVGAKHSGSLLGIPERVYNRGYPDFVVRG